MNANNDARETSNYQRMLVSPNALAPRDDAAAAETQSVDLVFQSLDDAETPTVRLYHICEFVKRGHDTVTNLLTASSVIAIEIGLRIKEAKEIVGHGQFLKWIDESLTPTTGIKQRTAQKYLRLAQNKSAILQTLQDHRRASDGNTLQPEEAQLVLQSLRVSDAMELLAIGGKSRPRNPSDKLPKITDQRSTPAHIFEAVEAFFGGEVDLYRGPCLVGGETFGATELQLTTPWHGTVFLDPPAGKATEDWIDLAFEQYALGSCAEVVLRLPCDLASAGDTRLESYPRIYERFATDDTHQSNVPLANPGDFMLVAMIRRARLKDFHRLCGPVGPLFVPFLFLYPEISP